MVATYEYDPYGNVISSTGSIATRSGYFGYAGEYTDRESKLVYLRARYYDPSTQQFINRDPLVGASGEPYGYVGGSPLNGRDPSGLWWETPLDILSLYADLLDVATNGLNWTNGIAIGADIVGLALPVVGGLGFAVRGVAHAGDVVSGGGRGVRTFFTVQNEADAARLLSGGAPWPTGMSRANLGEGLYTWETRGQAVAYMRGLEGRYGVTDLRVMRATISAADYSALRTLDLRAYSDEAVNAWMDVYSGYGKGLSHSYQHVIRSTGMGDEFYFSKDIFHLFRMR
ncbi:MAG TPA: RHS repeat-associated core domain-containing protein [Chloroflexia bacterium]